MIAIKKQEVYWNQLLNNVSNFYLNVNLQNDGGGEVYVYTNHNTDINYHKVVAFKNLKYVEDGNWYVRFNVSANKTNITSSEEHKYLIILQYKCENEDPSINTTLSFHIINTSWEMKYGDKAWIYKRNTGYNIAAMVTKCPVKYTDFYVCGTGYGHKVQVNDIYYLKSPLIFDLTAMNLEYIDSFEEFMDFFEFLSVDDIPTKMVARNQEKYVFPILKIVRTLNSGNMRLNHNLPEEYQEVLYIQSSGEQYILTNIKPTNTLKFDIKFKLEQEKNLSTTVFGSNRANLHYRMSTKYAVYRIGNDGKEMNTVHPGIFLYGKGSVNTFLGSSIVNELKFDGTNIITKYKTCNNSFGSYTFDDTAYPICLFALNTSEEIIQHCSCRLYYLKFISGDSIIAEYIPCYRKEDNKPGLYDTVSRTFLTNQGAGEFILGESVISMQSTEMQRIKKVITKAPLVREGYTFYEKIFIDKFAYINTEVRPDNNTKIIAKAEDYNNTMDSPLFGIYPTNATGNSNASYYHFTPYANKWYFGTNEVEQFGGTYTSGVHDIIFNDKGYVFVDGNKILTKACTFSSNGLLYIGSRGNPAVDGQYRLGTWYVYSFKIFQNDELIRDFIPANNGEEYGLYDLVNELFYTNDGSELLRASGNNSTKELKLIYDTLQSDSEEILSSDNDTDIQI